MTHDTDRVLTEVDNAIDELVAFAADLVRIPSVNPTTSSSPNRSVPNASASGTVARTGSRSPPSAERGTAVCRSSGRTRSSRWRPSSRRCAGSSGPRSAMRRTTMPVVPDGARMATLNLNAIQGGQAGEPFQTPCVAERCTAVFDRRFLIEEEFDQLKAEIVDLVDRTIVAFPGRQHVLRDLMVVPPVQTPSDAAVVGALGDGIRRVLGRGPELVASPGTYDHKHVARIAGIRAVRRLRARRLGVGAPARRVVRYRGSRQRDEGPRAHDSSTRRARLPLSTAPRNHSVAYVPTCPHGPLNT